jgi:hypothetical protein
VWKGGNAHVGYRLVFLDDKKYTGNNGSRTDKLHLVIALHTLAKLLLSPECLVFFQVRTHMR